MAASCPDVYRWANNAQGLDPCAAASKLISACDDRDPPLRPIHNGQQYPPPSTQNGETPCPCSVPIYALVSACADCQKAQFSTWRDWSAQCSVTFSDYPLPVPVTSIPDWAKININVQPSFDPEAAFKSATGGANSNTTFSAVQAAVTTTSNATSIPTSTLHTNTSSTSPQTSKQPSSSAIVSIPAVMGPTTRISDFATDGQQLSTLTQAPDTLATTLSSSSSDDGGSGNGSGNDASTAALRSTKKGGSSAGAIAGGVIGGLALLAILGVALVWWLRRRRRSRIAPSAAYLATYGATRPRTSLSTHPFAGARTESIAMSQNNSNSVSSYYDEEIVRDSLYSNGEQRSRNMLVPMSSPEFRGS